MTRPLCVSTGTVALHATAKQRREQTAKRDPSKFRPAEREGVGASGTAPIVSCVGPIGSSTLGSLQDVLRVASQHSKRC